MRFLILKGSPRPNRNTAELCKPFLNELESRGAEIRCISVPEKHILPCRSCYRCQDVDGYGCVQQDDMASIVKNMVWADCVVLATPIYTWYCPAEMKAMLDRTYGMNKYYGSARGSLWHGQRIALILTHGYDAQYAASPFIDGIRRYCEHSHLIYAGEYCVRDSDDNDMATFQTPEVMEGARAFARTLLSDAR